MSGARMGHWSGRLQARAARRDEAQVQEENMQETRCCSASEVSSTKLGIDSGRRRHRHALAGTYWARSDILRRQGTSDAHERFNSSDDEGGTHTRGTCSIREPRTM